VCVRADTGCNCRLRLVRRPEAFTDHAHAAGRRARGPPPRSLSFRDAPGPSSRGASHFSSRVSFPLMSVLLRRGPQVPRRARAARPRPRGSPRACTRSWTHCPAARDPRNRWSNLVSGPRVTRASSCWPTAGTTMDASRHRGSGPSSRARRTFWRARCGQARAEGRGPRGCWHRLPVRVQLPCTSTSGPRRPRRVGRRSALAEHRNSVYAARRSPSR